MNDGSSLDILNLLTQLTTDARHYADAELRLFKAEAAARLRLALPALLMLAVAALLLVAGVIALLMALVLALAPILTPLGAGVAVIAGAALLAALLIRPALARLRAATGALHTHNSEGDYD